MGWQFVTTLRGPAGVDGVDGEGAHYEQRFTGDTAEWQVVHGLGTTAVIVGVYDSAGAELLADVTVVDENTVRVHHEYPTAGLTVVQR